MRLTIALILIATIFTSCGRADSALKALTGGGGDTHNSSGNGITRASANLECSYSQVRTQCLDLASPALIPPRFFYYQQCYVEYRSCLRGFGF